MFTSSHLIIIIGFIQRQIYESGSGLSLVGPSVRLSVCLSVTSRCSIERPNRSTGFGTKSIKTRTLLSWRLHQTLNLTYFLHIFSSQFRYVCITHATVCNRRLTVVLCFTIISLSAAPSGSLLRARVCCRPGRSRSCLRNLWRDCCINEIICISRGGCFPVKCPRKTASLLTTFAVDPRNASDEFPVNSETGCIGRRKKDRNVRWPRRGSVN